MPLSFSSPLPFFSRKLSKVECGYSSFKRKLMPLHLAVRHFVHFLESTPLFTCTDHMPLINAFTQQSNVLYFIHGLSHPLLCSTPHLLKTKFILHGINKDAKDWIRTCTSCQTSKVHRHTDSEVDTVLQSQQCFAYIHVYVVGPKATSQGHRYLFTVIDCSTHWHEAFPMETATFASCKSNSLSGWIARFGIPEHITSNRGSTFISRLWISLANLLGMTLLQTHKPAAKGIIKRFHRTLKVALMSHCNDFNCFTQHPWALLGLRTTSKDTLDVSVAEMVYGNPLIFPANFFSCNLL
ncbi:protein NYNRIN-like [Palaemon carinicauda]|uniref:protein NYNRIN-like n=1 Tax=Palaemon carinicauda TaxID=392227 RepID=UPI0035B63BBA